MVTLAGIGMIFKGIYAFINQHELNHLDIGLAISVLSGVINYFLAQFLIKKGSKLHSPTMIADGKHLMTDTWSSIGLIIGLFIIYLTKLYWIDNVITIGLGGLITYTGLHLIKESVFNLLDKTDYIKIEHLIQIINSKRKSSWIDIHNLQVVKYGSVVHVDCHMTLPWYFTLEESHRELDNLDKMVAEEFSHEIEFFIHADPCLPASCSICEMHECTVRKQVFIRKLEWNISNILPDNKHTI